MFILFVNNRQWTLQ